MLNAVYILVVNPLSSSLYLLMNYAVEHLYGSFNCLVLTAPSLSQSRCTTQMSRQWLLYGPFMWSWMQLRTSAMLRGGTLPFFGFSFSKNKVFSLLCLPGKWLEPSSLNFESGSSQCRFLKMGTSCSEHLTTLLANLESLVNTL